VAFIPRPAAAKVVLPVAEYRAFVIGADGHFQNFRALVCDTDESAIAWAEQLLEDRPIELWSGARLVKRLSPRDNRKAISHEVHEGRMVPKEKK
jgi:hypothetical protein